MNENIQYGLDDWLLHPDVRIAINKNPQEAQEDAKLRRFKEKWLFVATLIALASVFAICIAFLALKPDSTYAGIALNGVIGLAMALAGYYVRGRTP